MDLGPVLEAIHNSNARVYVACTGAGAGLQGLLWSIPGCSSFLVGASFPYAAEATNDFLGFTPEHYCTPETALDLASKSFLRAGAGPDAIGIGLTASAASTAIHRGAHRVHAAWVSIGGAGTHDVVMSKGCGTEARREDGDIADRIGLNALLDAVGLPLLGGGHVRRPVLRGVQTRRDGTRPLLRAPVLPRASEA